MLPVFLTGALSLPMRAELGFRRPALGVAVSSFFAASALGSTLLGRLAQAIGPTRSMRIASVTGFMALLGIAALADSWIVLVALLVLAGLSNAFAQPAANLALAQGTPVERQGFAFGVKQSAIPVATLLAGLAVPIFAVTLGWRWAFVAGAGFALLTACTVPTLKRPASVSRAAGRIDRSILPALIVIAVAGGFGAAAANAMGVFMVDAAVESGWREAAAGTLLSVGSVFGLLVRLGSGWAIDRRQRLGLFSVAALMGVGSIGFLLLGLGPRTPVVYTLGTVVAFGAGWGWPGLFHFSVVHAYRPAAATATGLVQSGVFTGGVLGPMIFGYLAGAHTYALAWTVGAVALLCSATGISLAAVMLSDISDNSY